MNPDLAIIVVSWNTRDLLRDCLASVERHPPSVPYQVIVVDNASEDGSAEMVAELFPQVQLIRNTRNLGFAGGNNQAFSLARGRYLLLLNPDTVVLPGALDYLLAFLERSPGVGAAGARLRNPDGSLQPSCQVFPSLWTTFLDATMLLRIAPWQGWASRYDLRLWPHDAERSVDWVTGACLLVRRAVVEQVGGLDEGFFMYSEETDWCYRIRQAGWDIRFTPEAEVIHYGGAACDLTPDRMKAIWAKSYVHFFRKHHGPVQAWLARGLLALGYAWRLVLWASLYLLGQRWRSTARQKMHQWWPSLRWCLTGR